ncbi:hypothetical protein pb186bvf_003618 [Paramecium bursaria]
MKQYKIVQHLISSSLCLVFYHKISKVEQQVDLLLIQIMIISLDLLSSHIFSGETLFHLFFKCI